MAQPLSHYFYVMTHGYGAMPDYSAQIEPQDRWAIAAYIRALQLSQDATMSDVPAGRAGGEPEGCGAAGKPAGGVATAVDAAATAVWSNKGPAQKEGTPAMAPANTADPKQIAPAGQAGARRSK